MRWSWWSVIAVLGVLVVPSISANHLGMASPPPGGQEVVPRSLVIHQEAAVFEGVGWSNQVREVAVFNVEEQSTRAVFQRTHFIEASISVHWTNQVSGVGNLSVEVDGADLVPSCHLFFRSRDAIDLEEGGRAMGVHYVVMCEAPGLGIGVHNVSLRSTVHSGAPDTMAVIDVSVQVVQVDYEVVSMKTDFELLTGLTGLEFLAVVGVAGALLVVGTTTHHRPAKMVSAMLAVVLAVLLLFFHSSGVVVVLAAAIGLGAGVIFLLMAMDRYREARQARGSRRFFE